MGILPLSVDSRKRQFIYFLKIAARGENQQKAECKITLKEQAVGLCNDHFTN